jgi:hypothetical protein
MQKSNVFLLTLTLANAGVSAGLWMQLRAERALNAELSERLVLAAASPSAPSPVASPAVDPSPVIAPVVAAAPASKPAPPEPAVATPARFGPEDWQARQRHLMSDPRYREAFREQQRLRLATRRENLLRLIGMSPEQADAVIDLTIEQQMEMQMHQGWSDVQERAQQAKLIELLGQEKSAQLQTYMESRQSRMQVDRFRTQLTGADVLRDDQVEPLIAALHAEQSQMQRELSEFAGTLNQQSDPTGTQLIYMERETELLQETYDRTRSSAATILSGPQLRQLEAMLKRDIARRETQLRMQRMQSKFEPPPEVAGSSN